MGCNRNAGFIIGMGCNRNAGGIIGMGCTYGNTSSGNTYGSTGSGNTNGINIGVVVACPDHTHDRCCAGGAIAILRCMVRDVATTYVRAGATAYVRAGAIAI